ncbi:hypothetical protein E6O75_ATG05706 [Venturia nashicola]|uniref:Uncharacterized protein n=1 Tax=Venturia nashicola TaxID=86259 RepID=A0A4Z1P8S9_9PEZI|nr:hypothetical protein E6O75_ATG05706 [Venturia nashicola]
MAASLQQLGQGEGQYPYLRSLALGAPYPNGKSKACGAKLKMKDTSAGEIRHNNLNLFTIDLTTGHREFTDKAQGQ